MYMAALRVHHCAAPLPDQLLNLLDHKGGRVSRCSHPGCLVPSGHKFESKRSIMMRLWSGLELITCSWTWHWSEAGALSAGLWCSLLIWLLWWLMLSFKRSVSSSIKENLFKTKAKKAKRNDPPINLLSTPPVSSLVGWRGCRPGRLVTCLGHFNLREAPFLWLAGQPIVRNLQCDPTGTGRQLQLEEKVKSHLIDLIWGNLCCRSCRASVAALTLKKGFSSRATGSK